MEMKKINSGRLRAIGYDARARLLQVQLDDGSLLQYGGVGEGIRQRSRSQEPARRVIPQTLKNQRGQSGPLSPNDSIFSCRQTYFLPTALIESRAIKKASIISGSKCFPRSFLNSSRTCS